MGIIGWVIIGALAGWIASIIMKKNSEMGAFANIIIGIVGGLVGGFVFNAVLGIGITGFNLWSLLVAVVGSVILIALINAFTGKKSSTHSR